VKESVWQLLAEEIGADSDPVPVAGGCINHCALLTVSGSGRKVFAKTNSADKLQMFEAEGISLMALAATQTLRVPEVIRFGIVGDYSFLVLEHLPLVRGTPEQFRALGEKLATLHRSASEDGRFGFTVDNFIGATPQANPWHDRWADFFAEDRIVPQLELAARGGRTFAHGDQLVARIPDLLAGHEPQASLLHGDLWGGNIGFTPGGTPVIFDPASYYGDRETDLAFTEFFGGFGPEFYASYRHSYPLADGYETRRDLYNLYHVLNHYNLFGHSYGEQAEAMIRRLLVGF